MHNGKGRARSETNQTKEKNKPSPPLRANSLMNGHQISKSHTKINEGSSTWLSLRGFTCNNLIRLNLQSASSPADVLILAPDIKTFYQIVLLTCLVYPKVFSLVFKILPKQRKRVGGPYSSINIKWETEMPILRPHPRPAESGAVRLGPSNPCFNKPSR